MYLNEATLLNNIKNRYNKDKIYVSIDVESVSGSLTYKFVSPRTRLIKISEDFPKISQNIKCNLLFLLIYYFC